MRSIRAAGLVALLSCVCVSNLPAQSVPPTTSTADQVAHEKLRLAQAFGQLPLSFEANQGQTDARVKFLSHRGAQTLFLTSTEAMLVSKGEGAIRLRLVGSDRNAQISGIDQLPGSSNYFLGSDRTRWRTGIPSYRKVRYHDVYPGVDLIYYGSQRVLEYDFVLAPGASPRDIRLGVRGAKGLSLDADGNAVVHCNTGDLELRRPNIYQERNGKRTEVSGRYVLRGQEIRFHLGDYDPTQMLVIDPVLTYATYLGGPGNDGATGIAVDAAGNAYVVGDASTGFPLMNPGQPMFGGAADVFISKLNSSGTALIYSTYLGGSLEDDGFAIAVDSAGSAYVTGQTVSLDFPVTASAFQSKIKAAPDAFVTKLSPDGASLLYSTYLGGSANDTAFAIAVDSTGNAYVAGQTQSGDFPHIGSSPNVQNPVFCDPQNAGGFDAFIAKVSPNGSSLVYSLFLGGSGTDRANGVAVDSSGNAYVVGNTDSTNFLAANCPGPGPGAGSFQSTNAGSNDAFVVKVNPTGTSLLGATYLGGPGQDAATSVAVDQSGSVYVGGESNSAGAGGFDAFGARLDSSLTVLSYLTYFGGTGFDRATGIAVDVFGNAYLAGATTSPDLPMNSPIQSAPGSASTAFVAELNPSGAVIFSTYLGGSGGEGPAYIAIDPSGSLYIAGTTQSTDFPGVTSSSAQPANAGAQDAFIAKLSRATTTTTISASIGPSLFGQQVSFTATVSPTASSSLTPTGIIIFNDGATALGTATLTSGIAVFSSSGLSVGTHSIAASYAGDNAFAASTSARLPQAVNQGTTTASLSASPNPGIAGQPVTLTVAVQPVAPAAGTPSGSLTFLDGTTGIGTGTLAGEQATLTISSLSVGSHSLTVSYAGDTNFLASTSSALSLPVKQGTSTTLIASPNPSTTGQVVTLTATVASTPPSSSGGTPTGTVTFLDGSTALGTGALTGTTATFSTSSLSAGTHSLTASYPGDTAFASSTSAAVTETVILLITINESIHVSDAPTALPSAMITVSERITVTDTPTVLPAAQINVAENVSVTDAPTVGNTPTGSNVVVTPADTITGTAPADVTFTDVTQAGITSLVTSSSGAPPPTGFQIGVPPVFYDISTTATFTGPATVCINYSGIAFSGSSGPHLFHFENGVWVDRTTSMDATNMIVCGTVTSLSPFALFSRIAQVPLTITANSTSRQYGLGDPSFSASYDGFINGDGPSSLSGVLSCAGNDTAASPVGAYAITCSGLSSSNYIITFAPGRLTVTPAPLTITANSASRPYGANNPVVIPTVAGLLNGDVITAADATSATPSSPVGNYAIVPAPMGAANIISNYAISPVNGTLSVTPESTSLSVTLSPMSIPVGQSTVATITLTAPDMVIPIDPGVLVPVSLTSPVVSDIFSNNGACTLIPTTTPGVAMCTMSVTAVEPNGRTLDASFAGSANLLATSGAADVIVTAALQSQQVCISSAFHNVAVAGGNTIWFNAIFKVGVVPKQKINISFFKSSLQFHYTDSGGNVVNVNQPMPDARIVIDPSATTASTSFDSVDNVWITTIPWDLDDNGFLTGMPWVVPAGGIPADIEPVTVCGTFASDIAGIDIGWRWAAAAYSSFSGDNAALGVKPIDTDNDNPPKNHDRAGTPENFKQFVIPGARGKGGTNYTGTYSQSKEID